LQTCLVQIKFFNGVEDFNEKEGKIIHHIINKYKMQRLAKLSITEASMYFINKRHLISKSGSFLAEFVNRMELNTEEFKSLPIFL
jgi:hypothetical protein